MEWGRTSHYRFDPRGKSLPGLAHRAVLHAFGGVYRGVYPTCVTWPGTGLDFTFRHPRNDPESDFFVDEAGPQIEMVTDNPDYEPPELDLNNISIEAQPTRPDNPNGETLVTLKYRVRDNISGVSDRIYTLAGPTGRRTLLSR